MRKAFLILAMALPLLCACAETFSPSIKITPSLSNVPYTGGSVEIKVMTDLPWKAVLEDDDNTTVLSKTTGIGDDVVTVTLPETDNWTTECVTVKFYSSSNSATSVRTAYITQGYKPYVCVSGEIPMVPQEGGFVTMVVEANEPWTASCETPGVEINPASGEVGNFTITVRIPANTTGAIKRIIVNLAIDGDSDSINILQGV